MPVFLDSTSLHHLLLWDEKEMVLIGYLAFLDPPKPSAAEAIEQLYAHGVAVKIPVSYTHLDVYKRQVIRCYYISANAFLCKFSRESSCQPHRF